MTTELPRGPSIVFDTEAQARKALLVLARRNRVSPAGFKRGRDPDVPDEWDAPILASEFWTASEYLARLLRTKNPNRSTSSYGLKHCAERWGRVVGLESYVGGGTLILAAIYLGFLVEPYEYGSPHAALNVSRRSMDRLDRWVCERIEQRTRAANWGAVILPFRVRSSG